MSGVKLHQHMEFVLNSLPQGEFCFGGGGGGGGIWMNVTVFFFL